MDLIYGLCTGVLFGFLLQRGRVLRYDKQLGVLRLQDMTIIKFMLSAVLVGMVGIYLFHDLGVIGKLDIKSLSLGGNVCGGLLFGIGWALLGYCPGTQIGALGEGRWDAIWGMAGMIVGGMIYAEAYPLMKKTVLTWGSFGKITLPQALGLNHWFLIPFFVVGGLLFFGFLERKKL
jgi:hypothetical protein